MCPRQREEIKDGYLDVDKERHGAKDEENRNEKKGVEEQRLFAKRKISRTENRKKTEKLEFEKSDRGTDRMGRSAKRGERPRPSARGLSELGRGGREGPGRGAGVQRGARGAGVPGGGPFSGSLAPLRRSQQPHSSGFPTRSPSKSPQSPAFPAPLPQPGLEKLFFTPSWSLICCGERKRLLLGEGLRGGWGGGAGDCVSRSCAPGAAGGGGAGRGARGGGGSRGAWGSGRGGLGWGPQGAGREGPEGQAGPRWGALAQARRAKVGQGQNGGSRGAG